MKKNKIENDNFNEEFEKSSFDVVGKNNNLDEMLRVNLAGEYGAINIYRGQIAILKHLKEKMDENKDIDLQEALQEMLEGEEIHHEYFSKECLKRGIRPSMLAPFWRVGGFALGAFGALLSKEHAMLTTKAVEKVIADHYQSQINVLTEIEEEKELCQKITQFREEEIEHSDIAITHDAEKAKMGHLYSTAVENICKLSIAIAKKI